MNLKGSDAVGVGGGSGWGGNDVKQSSSIKLSKEKINVKTQLKKYES